MVEIMVGYVGRRSSSSHALRLGWIRLARPTTCRSVPEFSLNTYGALVRSEVLTGRDGVRTHRCFDSTSHRPSRSAHHATITFSARRDETIPTLRRVEAKPRRKPTGGAEIAATLMGTTHACAAIRDRTIRNSSFFRTQGCFVISTALGRPAGRLESTCRNHWHNGGPVALSIAHSGCLAARVASTLLLLLTQVQVASRPTVPVTALCCHLLSPKGLHHPHHAQSL